MLKILRSAAKPVYRHIRRQRIGAYGLGKGRKRRVGRALVSYVSDYVRYITQRAGRSVWDQVDCDRVLDQLYQGKFLGHEHHRTSADLVRELIERGFVVDCIYDRAGHLVDDVSGYDIIIDEWDNLPRWAAEAPHARTLFYGTGCHWLYWNIADLQRLQWLFQRQGVDSEPLFQLPPLLGLEAARLSTHYGNDAALMHYGVHRPKVRKLWVCPSVTNSEWKTKNWETARRAFLYFGSSRWVHRGLDLVIEAFLESDLNLYICGHDDAFLRVYGSCIRNSPNIHVLGFLVPGSEKFLDVVNRCAAVVYPSAAEGCSTSVVQCMHFGLIPLVTEATGLSIHDHWPALHGNTDKELISAIMCACRRVSESTSQQLEELSHWCWTFAGKQHSRDAYRASLRLVLDELMN